MEACRVVCACRVRPPSGGQRRLVHRAHAIPRGEARLPCRRGPSAWSAAAVANASLGAGRLMRRWGERG
eukprot:360672-Chlamydomonas_euryale.AAC.4